MDSEQLSYSDTELSQTEAKGAVEIYCKEIRPWKAPENPALYCTAEGDALKCRVRVIYQPLHDRYERRSRRSTAPAPWPAPFLFQ
jgi:hypothetical protein